MNGREKAGWAVSWERNWVGDGDDGVTNQGTGVPDVEVVPAW